LPLKFTGSLGLAGGPADRDPLCRPSHRDDKILSAAEKAFGN
jgi:hypothetical protein